MGAAAPVPPPRKAAPALSPSSTAEPKAMKPSELLMSPLTRRIVCVLLSAARAASKLPHGIALEQTVPIPPSRR